VCVTALPTVAEKVGTNRIMIAGGKFHYPFGNVDLPPEKETRWRKKMVQAALNLLARPVEGVTVSTPEEALAE
jgi:hypothetical protein